MANVTQSQLYGRKTVPKVAKCQRDDCDELWDDS